MDTNIFAIMNIQNAKQSAGGPAGYLYNLLQGFDESENLKKPLFFYLEDLVDTQASEGKTQSAGSMRDIFPGLRYLFYFIKRGLSFRHRIKSITKEIKLIHVHTSEAAIYLRCFAGYKENIILTPHRPETFKSEIINRLKNKKDRNYIITGFLLDRLESLSYRCSDAFIFPCDEAQKIYYDFPGYKKYAERKPISYVYTGISLKDVTIKRETYRSKYGIPNDAFLVGYVGRHNTIKGYDRLVDLADTLRNNEIYVIVGGNYDISKVPKSSHWIELGYISDAQNLMNACDVIAVPNRNTYFDLVIIEALSHGKIVITSNTGGNINLSKETDALILFENTDPNGLYEKIQEVANMDCEVRKEKERKAYEFYLEHCTCKKFANEYVNAVCKIYDRTM